jgi:hypothetical protein
LDRCFLCDGQFGRDDDIAKQYDKTGEGYGLE